MHINTIQFVALHPLLLPSSVLQVFPVLSGLSPRARLQFQGSSHPGRVSAGSQLPHRGGWEAPVRVRHLCERSSVRSLCLAGECRTETEGTVHDRLSEPHSLRHGHECVYCGVVPGHDLRLQQLLRLLGWNSRLLRYWIQLHCRVSLESVYRIIARSQ